MNSARPASFTSGASDLPLPPWQIVPSLLAADFGRLAEEIAAVEAAGADRLQLDIMDGHFVPNLSMGPLVIAAVRRQTRLRLEAHLMVEHPEIWIAPAADAGADLIIVHAEATPHLDRTLELIEQRHLATGAAINPATPPEALEEVLPRLDLVLAMTVNPGFGGQRFLPHVTRKISVLRQKLAQVNPLCDIEVDGGIEVETLPAAAAAGANVFVAGTAVFGHPRGPAAGLAALRNALPTSSGVRTGA